MITLYYADILPTVCQLIKIDDAGTYFHCPVCNEIVHVNVSSLIDKDKTNTNATFNIKCTHCNSLLGIKIAMKVEFFDI